MLLLLSLFRYTITAIISTGSLQGSSNDEMRLTLKIFTEKLLGLRMTKKVILLQEVYCLFKR
jgi:uncharacterized protein VirK/YbjX